MAKKQIKSKAYKKEKNFFYVVGVAVVIVALLAVVVYYSDNGFAGKATAVYSGADGQLPVTLKFNQGETSATFKVLKGADLIDYQLSFTALVDGAIQGLSIKKGAAAPPVTCNPGEQLCIIGTGAGVCAPDLTCNPCSAALPCPAQDANGNLFACEDGHCVLTVPNPVCGDGTCDATETTVTCPADCTLVTTCNPGEVLCELDTGVGVCAPDLTCKPCSTDLSCPITDAFGNLFVCEEGHCVLTVPNPVCGNDVCEETETSTGCPADCKIPDTCGNNVCEKDENCLKDCGLCAGIAAGGICSIQIGAEKVTGTCDAAGNCIEINGNYLCDYMYHCVNAPVKSCHETLKRCVECNPATPEQECAVSSQTQSLGFLMCDSDYTCNLCSANPPSTCPEGHNCKQFSAAELLTAGFTEADVNQIITKFPQGLSMCVVQPAVCGNSKVEAGEVCDGTELDGKTCVTEGFLGGTLACSSDCLSLDTSGCVEPNQLFEPQTGWGSWYPNTEQLSACTQANDMEFGNNYLNNPFIPGRITKPSGSILDYKLTETDISERYCDNDNNGKSRLYSCPVGVYTTTTTTTPYEAIAGCFCTLDAQCGYGWTCLLTVPTTNPIKGKCTKQ